MVLNYQLHKRTEKEIKDLISQKSDIRRREKNLIDKIENLKSDMNKIDDERKNWEQEKTLEMKKIKKFQREVKPIINEKEIKVLRKENNILKAERNNLEKSLNKSKNDYELTRAILRGMELKMDSLIGEKEAVKNDRIKLKNLYEKLEVYEKDAEIKFDNAKKERDETKKLLIKVKKKNREANGLKIKLGLKEKDLIEKEKELTRQRNEIKFRRQELDMAGKELQLKRELLSKAYTQANIEELDKKVEQMLASEKK